MSYQTIHLKIADESYPVYVGSALLKEPALFRSHIQGKQVMIVTQPKLAELYLDPLLLTLKDYHCDYICLPAGEEHKNLCSWQMIIDQLLAKGHERSTTLLALGGGMIGDLTGFAAASYLRGVNYLQLPTTVIAQVDSALGGKTGLNLPSGKNLVGAFYQPKAVIADLSTLESLPRREFMAGLAEVIKYGLIKDQAFFEWLEDHMTELLAGQKDLLNEAICRSILLKGFFIEQDPRETKGIRSLLNFGHTLGHALEAILGYGTLLHGEAVAIGMGFAARLSLQKGLLKEQDCQRIQNLIQKAGLLLECQNKLNLEELLTYLKKDKKVEAGRLRFVLLRAIGEACLSEEVSEEDLTKLIPHP